MDSTCEINVEDQSNVQVETNETPTHDVLETGNVDVTIEYDEHDHSVKMSLALLCPRMPDTVQNPHAFV
ncbi:hypothetical protein Tco_1034039 [Tanacetum coccineum]